MGKRMLNEQIRQVALSEMASRGKFLEPERPLEAWFVGSLELHIPGNSERPFWDG